jgi:hypothetical protein
MLIKMHTVYNLEMQVRDKMNRIKKSSHVGVYGSLEDIETAKVKTLAEHPSVTFEVYPCEHILFEQQPD